MTRIRAFVQDHPAASYFALTFAISWGGLVAIVGPAHVVGTKQEFERLFPLVLPFLVLGPSVTGLVMTWLVDGRPGLRDYRARLLRWRVDARWYAVALLTAPVYFVVAGLVMAAFSARYLPAIFTSDDMLALVTRGLVVAVVAGVVEELGWTGFAVPALRRSHGPTATGLIVGLLWGAWHVLPKVWGAAAHGVDAYPAPDLLGAVVGLSGFRILMVWVYERTQSLWIAILMHAGLTASTLILQPLLTGKPLVIYGQILAAVPWLIVGAVAAIRRGRSHGPWSAPSMPHPAR